MTNESIPFSIADYEKYVLLVGTHQVETRKGKAVRVLSTDRKTTENRPVVCLVDSPSETFEEVLSFLESGRHSYHADTGYDLFIVPIPPKSLGWIVLYENKSPDFMHASFFSTEDGARSAAKQFGTAVSITEIFANV